jgi:hypothetical protein
MKLIHALFVLFVNVFFPLVLQAGEKEQNQHLNWKQYTSLDTGIVWPRGQALPQFATPCETLDGLDISQNSFTPSERDLFVALQGLVNKNKPRIFLFDVAGEGKNKWPENLHLRINEYPEREKWSLVKKYRQEIKGVVLYSTENSIHYLNLAMTVGALKNALPVTAAEYKKLEENGIRLPVLTDLTRLSFTTPVEIYQYLYANYWKSCSKRVLISLNAKLSAHIRDMGVAAGAAFVWLDPRKAEEKTVLERFFKDMKAGQSIVLGWWPEERSGIGTGTSFGISTIPSDFYENATVYAGMSHIIELAEVPKKPKLENKIYLTIFLSDGDNVQYCQHTMPRLWDDKNRGKLPINWTVSPGLADIGPALLNYFYATASANDFFASGPSGLGYALIYDAHNKKWNLTDPALADAYTKFTQQYEEKSGFRVITLWDEISEQQMELYATNCRYLYGCTLEDWERSKPLPTVVKKEKMAFIPNFPCYAGNIDAIYQRWEKQIRNFDGTKPLFLTTQGVSWKMGPNEIADLKMKLEKLSPGNVVICRGDHFFTLFNEANRLDFNLTLSPGMEITSSQTSTQAAYAADGSAAGKYMWVSSGTGEKWIRFDFNGTFLINRYVVRHAEAAGMDAALNTRSFRLEVSNDGNSWETVSQYRHNADQITDTDLTPVKARFARLAITDPGKDKTARIGDVEIYGRRL